MWRKLQSSSFYKDSYAVHLALHLVYEANHKPKKFLFNGKEQTLERGQTLSGRFALALDTGMHPSTIRNKLALLKKVGFLDIKPTNKFSIITIIKYSYYQNATNYPDTKQDNNRTTDGQQMDTNNKLKELKELNKEIEKPVKFEKPTPIQVKEYALSIGFASLNPQAFCDHYESKGWLIGKSPMKDWRAAVRTWKHKDNPIYQKPTIDTTGLGADTIAALKEGGMIK